MSSEEGQTIEFVPLLNFEDNYEILNQYPFTIRKKSNKRVIKESIDGRGYPRIHLNGKDYRTHRLIAKQFLPNPDNLPEVDHISRDRSDYHLSNLRWVSSSENNINKLVHHNNIQYSFVDDISDDAMSITFYDALTERKQFDEGKYYYWFDEDNDEDIFYVKITDKLYKTLLIHHNKAGNKYVNLKDINNKFVQVMIYRFKQQSDLI